VPALKTKTSSSDRQLSSKPQVLMTSRGTMKSKSAADITSQDRASVAA